MIIAGPCSLESKEQLLEVTSKIEAYVDAIRVGIWKPRTHPNTFEGVGEIGLKWVSEVKKKFNIPFAIEVANSKHVEKALNAGIDILWIGARSTVSPFVVQDIIDAVKGVNVPLMIKNPIAPDLGTWVGAVERAQTAGIENILLIHRGFCTAYNSNYRNDPLWDIPLNMKKMFPELPLICDPSHISGDRKYIPEIIKDASNFNYSGFMIEVHPEPKVALSDSKQQIKPSDLIDLLDRVEKDEYKMKYMTTIRIEEKVGI